MKFSSGFRWQYSLLLAVVMLSAMTEARALNPTKAFSQYIATNWNIQNGLSQATVNAIAQTDDGFLWLATEEGLVRYDGLRFVTFDEQNTPGLDDRLIRSLAPTPEGGLWIGTSTGLVRYKHGRFSSLRKQTQFFFDVYDLAVTRDGSVWFSSDTGLRRYTEALRASSFHQYTTKDGLPSNGITGLVDAEDGTLWIGTRHGLVHYADDRFITYPCPQFSKKPGDITSVAVGRGVRNVRGHEALVWIGLSDGSIAKWSGGQIVPVWKGEATAGASVWSLHEDHDGTLWVAFRKVGLGRLRGGSMELLTRANGLPSTSPDWVFEDRERNLWVGWVDMGMSMFRDGQFTVVSRSEGMSSDMISSVAKSNGGDLWVGTEDGGINRLSKGQGKLDIKSKGPGLGLFSGVMAVLQQRDGTLWVGSDHGSVTRIQRGRATTFSVPGPLTPGLRSMVEDGNGEVWFGFEMPNGLARLRNGRFEFQKIPGIVSELAMDPDGSLWIAAYTGGLVQYKNGVVRTYTQKDGLANLALTSVYVGADGTVWAGTMLGGLYQFKNGKITQYSIKQGLSDSTVGEIIADTEGYLWLAGTRGIMRVSLSQLSAYAARTIDKVTVRTFGFTEGLRSVECNFKAHSAALRDDKGQLWFATLSGLAMIDPRQMRRDEVAPKPIVTELIANGRTVAMGPSGYRIEPGQNALSVRFAAPSFVAPEQTQIRYRLAGLEENWVWADSRQRQTVYSNLTPGRYRFELQAANGDGVSSGESATLSFDVLPHYYETWWFRLLLAVGALLAVWLSLRQRTRRLTKKNRDLEALVLEQTAEIRGALESAEESREMLRELALRDTLTGLWNRRAIFEILETQMQQFSKDGKSLTVIMADIDHFKSINDTWGHQAGDEVICEVSRRLTEGMRTGDAVGRYGGEELLILLPDAPMSQGIERAEMLREVICREPVKVDAISIGVSCSFGLTFIQPESTVSDIVEQADAALYQAKRDGRNCVRLQLPVETTKNYENSLAVSAQQSRTIEDSLCLE